MCRIIMMVILIIWCKIISIKKELKTNKITEIQCPLCISTATTKLTENDLCIIFSILLPFFNQCAIMEKNPYPTSFYNKKLKKIKKWTWKLPHYLGISNILMIWCHISYVPKKYTKTFIGSCSCSQSPGLLICNFKEHPLSEYRPSPLHVRLS